MENFKIILTIIISVPICFTTGWFVGKTIPNLIYKLIDLIF